ncbi:MAG TPA: efflux RND transporter periplasmic adaptor subunit [Clostridiales bacterium]|nr:efflux RND transporter periplasmic adaptor subunit [Clostridiales bacterium]
MPKHWTTKKKVYTVFLILVPIILVSLVLYYMLKPAPPQKVSLVTVGRGDIVQTLDATGTVESSNQERFNVLNGTKVLQVNFRVGDTIKKGDVLATFDTSSLGKIVESKQKTYNLANEAYINARDSARTSAADLVQLEKDIKKLEEEIKELEKKMSKAEKEEANKAQNPADDKLKALFGNNLILSILTGRAFEGFDLSSLTGFSAEQTKLSTMQFELMQLQAKQTIAKAQASGALESTLKAVSESAYEDLQATREAIEVLKAGWVAKEDGIVREVKITEGKVFEGESAFDTGAFDLSAIMNLMSSGSEDIDLMGMIKKYLAPDYAGMVVEYYPFEASFVLGKYDVLKVKMDQGAIITSASGKKFDGIITFISPVASSSSSININSILGTGGGSSNGVEAKVTIPNPDSSIIIGFDVDISIDVDKAENTVLVPAEALQFDSEGSYVFFFNEKTKRVVRSQVKTGIFSGTFYQILEGVEEGNKIIKAPPLTLKDGDKVSIQSLEEMTVTETTKTKP